MLGAENLYTAAQARALDQCAICEHSIAGTVLMARAADVALEYLLEVWPEPKRLQVICGTGNNGGDGFLIADLAHKRGIKVTAFQLGDRRKISGDAVLAMQQAQANGVEIVSFDDGLLLPEGVVVDAMLGTGLGGEVRGVYVDAIAAINACAAPVLAVDMPSGLCADTGTVLGSAVVADLTVSFVGLKRGLFTLQGPEYSGAVQFSDLAVPPEVYAAVAAPCARLELEPLLPKTKQVKGCGRCECLPSNLYCISSVEVEGTVPSSIYTQVNVPTFYMLICVIRVHCITFYVLRFTVH